MKAITAYMWGYWGWGNHSQEFVKTVDAIERSRGRRPPIFVDVRYARGGRAKGFHGETFEATLGDERYHWLKCLGNEKIKKKNKPAKASRRRIKIVDPLGVVQLLGLVVDANRDRRRVIFYCACKEPWYCHRTKVAKLLVKAAALHGIVLTVVEWPGRTPLAVKLHVDKQLVAKALRSENRISLDALGPKKLRELAALPWHSRVELQSDDVRAAVIAGPARLASAGWFLPVIGRWACKSSDTLNSLKDRAARQRRSHGYEPIRYA